MKINFSRLTLGQNQSQVGYSGVAYIYIIIPNGRHPVFYVNTVTKVENTNLFSSDERFEKN